ncbi:MULTISPECIES: HNH endonuclease [Pantoea]|uniref:HNH endonuclease n=1 Tax=Pantoea TaxID=53335 RepID=UPI0013156439|nr:MULTISPECIES: HNH endonuclease [Pantoea]
MRERPILLNADMVRNTNTNARIYPGKGLDQNSPEHLARRLANGCCINEQTECWEWQRHTNNAGYGKLTINGRGVYAHRLAYQLTKGDLPQGMEVLHSCDNPACINPAHLAAGTHSQNMKDCSAKGRAKMPTVIVRGERNGAAKLREVDVRSIKRLLEKGWTQRDIAERFGISQSQVSHIKLGRAWVIEFKRVEVE